MRAKVARRLRKAASGSALKSTNSAKYKALKWAWKTGRIKK